MIALVWTVWVLLVLIAIGIAYPVAIPIEILFVVLVVKRAKRSRPARPSAPHTVRRYYPTAV